MTVFPVGSFVEHRKYGPALVTGLSASGVRIKYAISPEGFDGETEDIVCVDDLQLPSPYSNADVFRLVVDHLSVLFEPDDRICITFIKRSAKIAENVCISLAKAATKTGVARLQVHNEAGADIYIAMNPLLPDANQRLKELAGTPRNVFMEVDDEGDKVLAAVRASVTAGEIPDPSVILCSSPSKYQFIWHINPEEFTADKIEAVNEALVQKFGGDPACTDHLRLFRIPGLRNLKYPQRPVVETLSSRHDTKYGYGEFKIPIGAPKEDVVRPVAADDELSGIVDYFEEAADQAHLAVSPLKKWGNNGYLWELTCPWVSEHTGQLDSGTVVILHKSGALDFVCRHGHCRERNWPKDFRPYLEGLVKHSLRFGDPVGNVVLNTTPSSEPITLGQYPEPVSDGAVIPVSDTGEAKLISVNNLTDPVLKMIHKETVLPPFDLTKIKGFYSELVGLVTQGNTLPAQFPFGIARTILGLRATGRTIFEGCDLQPRYYLFMIGEPGVGKGASWRRTMNVLTMNNSRVDFNQVIKVFNSADSGAGIKEAFFSKTGQGLGIPVALYIDEIMDLGSKSRTDRNPEIITTMLDLYNSNSLTRLKANTDWTCHNAKLAVVMCGQPSLISMSFSNMKSGEVGWYDRLTPEIAYPQEIEDVLRPLEASEVVKVAMAFDALPYDSIIKESTASTKVLKEYRASLSKIERSKGRRFDHMKADMYMLAFGRRSKITEPEDAHDAIYLDQRQHLIRTQYLQEEVPDRVGDYSKRIKMMIKAQILAQRAGAPLETIMKTERDYMTYTNAYRKNEEVYFNRAWASLIGTTLRPIDVASPNGGPKTRYYLPV